MRRHLRNPWIWVVAAIVLAVWLFWPRTVNSPAPGEAPPSHNAPAGMAAAELAPSALPAFLPVEARETVALIQRGGPYPHRQDGGVFQNRERHLPDMPRGFYREYTVETPGSADRGARRIITGGAPPSTWYYTDDHYDSFRSFEVAEVAR